MRRRLIVSIDARNDSAKVLVIQDFPPVQLEPLTALLRRFGCDVITAFEGQDGLSIASAQHPDLIICDIATPDMSGSELCRRIRSHPKIGGIPVLLVSGLRRDSDPVLAAFKAGVSDYLKMPYDPMHLLAKTARLIERRRAEKICRQRETYYRLMVENSADRVSLLREDLITVYENSAAERQTGYNPEELVGKSYVALVHPEDVPRVMEMEIGAVVEYRHLHKDGSFRLVQSIGQRFADESGVVSFVVNTRDVPTVKR
jgi:PAS domain S-box-containing protein